MTTIFFAKTASIPIDRGLLNNAVAFFNAGSRCMADIALSPLVVNCPMTPAVVNYAFSAELYLKLLTLLINGSPARGHKLLDLFRTLPEASRQRIQELAQPLAMVANFPQELERVSNAFVEWRYEHEHETLMINPAVLTGLAKACHTLVRELRPDLRTAADPA